MYIFCSDQEVGLLFTLHTDTFTVLYVLNKIIIITSLIFTADRIQAVCAWFVELDAVVVSVYLSFLCLSQYHLLAHVRTCIYVNCIDLNVYYTCCTYCTL